MASVPCLRRRSSDANSGVGQRRAYGHREGDGARLGQSQAEPVEAMEHDGTASYPAVSSGRCGCEQPGARARRDVRRRRQGGGATDSTRHLHRQHSPPPRAALRQLALRPSWARRPNGRASCLSHLARGRCRHRARIVQSVVCSARRTAAAIGAAPARWRHLRVLHRAQRVTARRRHSYPSSSSSSSPRQCPYSSSKRRQRSRRQRSSRRRKCSSPRTTLETSPRCSAGARATSPPPPIPRAPTPPQGRRALYQLSPGGTNHAETVGAAQHGPPHPARAPLLRVTTAMATRRTRTKAETAAVTRRADDLRQPRAACHGRRRALAAACRARGAADGGEATVAINLHGVSSKAAIGARIQVAYMERQGRSRLRALPWLCRFH